MPFGGTWSWGIFRLKRLIKCYWVWLVCWVFPAKPHCVESYLTVVAAVRRAHITSHEKKLSELNFLNFATSKYFCEILAQRRVECPGTNLDTYKIQDWLGL